MLDHHWTVILKLTTTKKKRKKMDCVCVMTKLTSLTNKDHSGNILAIGGEMLVCGFILFRGNGRGI